MVAAEPERFALAVGGFVIGFALGWWLLDSATEAAQIIVAFALGGVVAIVGYAVVRIGVYLAGGLLGALLALIVLSFLSIESSAVNVLVILADDLGYSAMENICTVHDLHATMLHQLGIRHDAFSFKFQGLDARLTGVEGAKIISNILA